MFDIVCIIQKKCLFVKRSNSGDMDQFPIEKCLCFFYAWRESFYLMFLWND
jgi:hypothetical protein